MSALALCGEDTFSTSSYTAAGGDDGGDGDGDGDDGLWECVWVWGVQMRWWRSAPSRTPTLRNTTLHTTPEMTAATPLLNPLSLGVAACIWVYN